MRNLTVVLLLSTISAGNAFGDQTWPVSEACTHIMPPDEPRLAWLDSITFSQAFSFLVARR